MAENLILITSIKQCKSISLSTSTEDNMFRQKEIVILTNNCLCLYGKFISVLIISLKLILSTGLSSHVC